MRIYLDVCCLNRPFDDQVQERISLETEAILKILEKCENGIWSLIWSSAISQEIELTPDDERKKSMGNVEEIAEEKIKGNASIKKRAFELETMSFKFLDATHIAFAEHTRADIFLTTDDKLLKKYAANRNKISITIDNPVNWLLKGNSDE
jgi:hypothetical protein